MTIPKCEVMVVHTPIRREVCTVPDLRKVEKQRDYLLSLLEEIYDVRGEYDKVNCKIVRIKSQLIELIEESIK